MDIDRYFLELALEEAEKALSENTYPVGAVIVDDNQQVVATGRNRVHSNQDATAHAEIEAIRHAGNSIFRAKIHRENFVMYTTLEPCPMCTGGILFAKINKVVWLLNDDQGFGSFKKFQHAGLFEHKLNEMEVVEEPFADLKQRQIELMSQWENNAHHIKNLRRAAIED